MGQTINRVQAASGVNTTFASSVSATFASDNQKGNTILLAVQIDIGTQNSANTPTDTAGNTYTRVLSNSLGSVFDLEIWVAYNCKFKVGNVVTVTDVMGGVDSILIVEEWSNVSTVIINEGFNSSNGSGTSLSSGSIDTETSVDLIWAAGVVSNGSNTLSAGSGFSNLTQNSTAFSNLGVCSQITSSFGNYTGSLTTSASGSWVCGVVALRSSWVGFNRHISVGNGMSSSEVAN